MPITVGTLGRLRAVDQQGADIILSFESSNLVLSPVSPNVMRHTWVPTHWRLYTERVIDGLAVARRFWPAGPRPLIKETAERIIIEAGEMVVEASREPFHLRYGSREGRVFLEEQPEGGLSWNYWDYQLSYALAADEHFYGMGQADQLGEVELDHRGQLREVWNQHSPPAATIFPALLSSRGYGLLVDNASRATWDLGHSDPLSFAYRARGGGLQYYVAYGPELPRLLSTLAALTGSPPLPPRWVFGLLQSRYGYRSRDELEDIAEEFRSRQLPCDALILDVFWFREMGDLAFDSLSWPDAPAMLARLRQRGFRTIVIEEPYLTLRSRNYPEAQARGYLATGHDGTPYTFDFWPGQCALVDFSNPAARGWWSEQHRPLLEMGIDGWWTDLNEPAKHFRDMRHYGGSAAGVHNSFALMMQSAVHEAHQRYAPRKRVFILSRSAFAGSQRYGTGLWSGDVDMTFTALRKQLALGLNVGLAGIALWGSDIGGFGFGGNCTPELYVRWFQFGAFCPLCRPHGDQYQRREPWNFGPEVEAICRKYLEIRYRLLPYIYNAAHETCRTGMPIMRPLLLAFPGDPRVTNLSDEYLFASEILVAPVVDEGATERNVYLPDGEWVDYWTDEIYQGPRDIVVHAELDTLPLFIRAGAVIPEAPPMQYSSERLLDPLTLQVYRGGDRLLSLYEDDGETNDYLNGVYSESRFELAQDGNHLVFRSGPVRGALAECRTNRRLRFCIHRQPRPGRIICDRAPLPELSPEILERGGEGWHWEQARQLLEIALSPGIEERVIKIS